MIKENLIELINQYPLFAKNQKEEIINKIKDYDENACQELYNKLQEELNNYDKLLNQAYDITIKYKDKLKENWSNYLKKMLKNLNIVQKNEDENIANSLLKELDKI